MIKKQKLSRRALLKIKPGPHFSWREFACHDGTGYIEGLMRHEGLSFYRAWRRGRKLGKYLEATRRKVGKPIKVTSAYRTPSYNRKIGGEANSAHLRGYAADMDTPAGMTISKFAALCRKIWPSGIGTYPTSGFVHGDYDPVLGRRDWHE